MRKFKDYVKLVSEANLAYDEPLMKELSAILDHKGVSADSPIRAWFKTQYLKWFKSPEDDNEKPVTNHQYAENEPEWMKKDGIVDFTQFDNSQKQKLLHVVDYFNTLSDLDLKKIVKEPLGTIKRKVYEWDKSLKLKNKDVKRSPLKEGEDFREVYKTTDDNGNPVRWVNLLTKKATKFEGNAMSICVGDSNYDPKNIYSLYDEYNIPHVTMELQNDNEVHQIKGENNAPPESQYVKPIIEFIKKQNYVVKGDGENVGMVSWNDTYYFEDSDSWKSVYEREVIPKQQRVFDELKRRIRIVANEAVEIYLESLKKRYS